MIADCLSRNSPRGVTRGLTPRPRDRPVLILDLADQIEFVAFARASEIQLHFVAATADAVLRPTAQALLCTAGHRHRAVAGPNSGHGVEWRGRRPTDVGKCKERQ